MTSQAIRGTADTGSDLLTFWSPVRTHESGVELRRITVADFIAHNVHVKHPKWPGYVFSLDVSITRGDVRRFEVITMDDNPTPITKVKTLHRVPWDEIVKAARKHAAMLVRQRVPVFWQQGFLENGEARYADALEGLTPSHGAESLLTELEIAPRAQDRKRSKALSDYDVVAFLYAYVQAVNSGESVESFLKRTGWSTKSLENRKRVGASQDNEWFIPRGNRQPGGTITARGLAVLAAAKQEGPEQ